MVLCSDAARPFRLPLSPIPYSTLKNAPSLAEADGRWGEERWVICDLRLPSFQLRFRFVALEARLPTPSKPNPKPVFKLSTLDFGLVSGMRNGASRTERAQYHVEGAIIEGA